jgi:hypothetical protein
MTSLRRLRNQRALAVAGLVAVAVPMLSSCGFNSATENPNVIANGGYHVEGDVHVMAARIVTPSQGTGTFVATISADPESDGATLTGITGDGITAARFTPIEVQSNGSVNLFTEGGIAVTGDFAAGENIPLTLTFQGGDSIDVGAVVVKQCYEYADVKTAGSSKASASAAPTTEPYTCEYPSADASTGGAGEGSGE